jgi:glycerol-3-phosphate O-acyltransferase / dihydroxyacetone phosphate acyltransferase
MPRARGIVASGRITRRPTSRRPANPEMLACGRGDEHLGRAGTAGSVTRDRHMWLLPAFSPLSRIATRTYYRLRTDGGRVPEEGPVLLVANHPNSLLDPALVCSAAGRPVRFLARAPLFSYPILGVLVRGAGAIPVHRRQDAPVPAVRNLDAFATADAALAAGSAIGIFPEGISHDEPSIAPLRTGAARIGLAAAQRLGGSFPIVPVGLVFRDKEVFRSEALVLVGEPVEWEDLAGEGTSPGAVQELTERIGRALRRVTINLEHWEDAPLVETADAIYAAEFRADRSARARVSRVRAGIQRLAELRRTGDERWQLVAKEILRHRRVLRRLGLTPADLYGSPDYRDAARRAVRHLPLLSILALAGGAVGNLLFWVPYRAIGRIERRLKPLPYVRSTTKLFAGVVAFGAWIGSLALVAGWLWGPLAGAITAAVLPLAAVATLRLREEWSARRQDLRRLFLMRTRGTRLADLQGRQRSIALQIAELAERGAPSAETPNPLTLTGET